MRLAALGAKLLKFACGYVKLGRDAEASPQHADPRPAVLSDQISFGRIIREGLSARRGHDAGAISARQLFHVKYARLRDPGWLCSPADKRQTDRIISHPIVLQDGR